MGEEESMEQESMSEEPPTQLLAPRANPGKNEFKLELIPACCWTRNAQVTVLHSQLERSPPFRFTTKNHFSSRALTYREQSH
jgi:hypothetical protein